MRPQQTRQGSSSEYIANTPLLKKSGAADGKSEEGPVPASQRDDEGKGTVKNRVVGLISTLDLYHRCTGKTKILVGPGPLQYFDHSGHYSILTARAVDPLVFCRSGLGTK